MAGKYAIARQLSGKKVVTNEGEDFGKVVDININEVTGSIEALVVDPNPDSELASKMKKEDGLVCAPYECVLAVGDYVLVDRKNITSEV
ncbi:MAG: PRC-barrel domain-containing protein [Candidatus Anstonellales archaeon]